jgi:hypothetical protein
MKKHSIRTLRILSSLTLLLVLASCATQGRGKVFSQAPRVSPGKATVIHYRREGFVGSAGEWGLYANREPLVIVGNGGYFVEERDPGTVQYQTEYTLKAPIGNLVSAVSNAYEKPKDAHSLQLSPNERVYLRYEPPASVFRINSRPEVIRVDESTALQELLELKQFMVLSKPID